MAHLKYQSHDQQSRDIHSRNAENVLDALLRQGINIPFSCRSGVCHVCVQQCRHGDIPPSAQKGLAPELVKQGYFLPCQCTPVGDMQIAAPTGLFQTTLVHSKEMLSSHVCRILLEPPTDFAYKAGQFINLRRPDGITRSYSLASLPAEDYFLELHVLRQDGGIMSNWLVDELNTGDGIDIQNAEGSCHYQTTAEDSPLLMIGTGTGLAPLIGIVRDALHHRHQHEIHLYHGGRSTDRFYLHEQLRQLEQAHSNFHYHECISGTSEVPENTFAGRVHEIAFSRHPNVHGWNVYLAGLAEMVDSGTLLAARHGALPHHIHSDAFTLRDLRQNKREDSKPQPEDDDSAKYPPPDAALWAALQDGKLLTSILTDFYTMVYADEKLASFFNGVTKQRLIEKQYLFIRQILTGEKVYFGDRPRNSHHWMVISDELFDHRESIMLHCLHKHGLPEPMIHRFMEMEGFYRRDIVKAAPFARVIGGIEKPFEGFDEITMDVGTLCDSCSREVAPGEKVIYHVRIGKIHCSDCSTRHHHEIPPANAGV
ncbi:2Fe-2S iron-sulfur cluster-binding protein [Methylotenera sp. G11]|uniref:2Fe-2S iron-sulfur cluster-binding protein n=1 Tax=Methylotenera sp. G11 TaxID=1506585 RepID=UPI00068A5F2C|nr:2Fe-2S iron-sulfur cluster-binding protein [Methylotenera sp. G11]